MWIAPAFNSISSCQKHLGGYVLKVVSGTVTDFSSRDYFLLQTTESVYVFEYSFSMNESRSR